MSRRKTAKKRPVAPDAVYQNNKKKGKRKDETTK